jgi:hypothetical protein
MRSDNRPYPHKNLEQTLAKPPWFEQVTTLQGLKPMLFECFGGGTWLRWL